MSIEKAEKKYHELFPTDKEKAEAFDLIAGKYYYMNFGSTSKTDFDVLMFSIYLERILADKQNVSSDYSDYTLSKLLGITQTKVSNLKVKKELLYPNNEIRWKETLLTISDRAIFENNQIKLYVPERIVFLEVKNAIEELGGFVEIQLTPNLLQVNLAFFLDLMVSISEKEDRAEIRNKIRERIAKNEKDSEELKKQPFGKLLRSKAPNMIIDVIGECIPVFGGVVSSIATNVYNVLKGSQVESK